MTLCQLMATNPFQIAKQKKIVSKIKINLNTICVCMRCTLIYLVEITIHSSWL